MKLKQPKFALHTTAIIEKNVKIGESTAIWNHVHVRKGTVIGHHCIVGEKTYIAYDVQIGNYVKINAFVYIPTGVTIKDAAMISAGVIFVNDKYPRAYDYRTGRLRDSSPDGATLNLLVDEGATIGAGCTILGDLTIGRFSLVGAGSVVTKSVKPHSLVMGSPAKHTGWVCRCGAKLLFKKSKATCFTCHDMYGLDLKSSSPILLK